MAARGLPPALMLPGDWSSASGYEAIARLESLPSATAIIAANDQMALGAMLALKHRGLRIPEDVSVVGIDNIPEAAYFDPPLTTLNVDFAARGRESVAVLLAKIGERVSGEVTIPVPEVVVRASSGPAKR